MLILLNQSEDILAGPRTFQSLFEVSDLVFKLGSELGVSSNSKDVCACVCERQRGRKWLW